MQVTVNGQAMTIETPCTVAELLKRVPVTARAYAVEVNAKLVPRREHPTRPLAEGDRVEVVTLVGGG